MERHTLTVLLAVWFASPSLADGIADMQTCMTFPEPLESALRICSSAINSGNLTEDQIGETLFARGIIYYRLADYESSIDDLNLTSEFDPENARVYFYKGLAFEAQGEAGRADGQYRNAYFYDPEDPEILAKMSERALLN